MTYQEKIEALSGTIYDYDDVIDKHPDYFDYDVTMRNGVLGMIRGNVERVVIPADLMLLMAGQTVRWLRQNRLSLGTQTDHFRNDLRQYSVLGYGCPKAGHFRNCRPIALRDAGPRG